MNAITQIIMQRLSGQAHTNSPDVMGMLGSMLDQNKDGSAVDDLQRLAANFFK